MHVEICKWSCLKKERKIKIEDLVNNNGGNFNFNGHVNKCSEGI